MNSEQRFFIGSLLNDDEKRIQLADTLNEDFIYDPELLKLVRILKEPNFSFELICKTLGQKSLLLAMELANEHTKFNLEIKHGNNN